MANRILHPDEVRRETGKMWVKHAVAAGLTKEEAERDLPLVLASFGLAKA